MSSPQAAGGAGSEGAIKARERLLLPVYTQVALQFAQMHDGPVRMLAKGVLRGIVPWREARSFFAARLRRRLTEEALLKHIAGTLDFFQGEGLVFRGFPSFVGVPKAAAVLVLGRPRAVSLSLCHPTLAILQPRTGR